jgi:phenylacetate-CoA ligase
MPLQLLSGRIRRDIRAAHARLRRPVETGTELERRQLSAISTIWSNAVADVPYFAQMVADKRAPSEVRSWTDVGAIPVLTRQALQDQRSAFVRRSGPPHGYVNTAGSTGTPLHIGMNAHERDLMRVVKLAEWQAFGYRASSRLFLIWGHQHLLGSGWRSGVNATKRSLTDWFLGYQRVDAYRLTPEICRLVAAQLIAFRPVGLIGYAAALDLFARYTRDFRARFRELNLGFVMITTEAPPRSDTAAILGDLFGCPVVEEYGGGDFGQVAFKRGTAPFHVYPDLNYVECDALAVEDEGVCPVLVTSLYARYTPLIRYRIGDGVMTPRRFPHGHVAAFERVAGRLTDAVALDSGDAIHSLAIFHCVHGEPDIYNVQMRLADDGIDILLVTSPNADRAAIESRVRPRLARVHPKLAAARFKYDEDVTTSRAGKRRWCIDERSVKPLCVA